MHSHRIVCGSADRPRPVPVIEQPRPMAASATNSALSPRLPSHGFAHHGNATLGPLQCCGFCLSETSVVAPPRIQIVPSIKGLQTLVGFRPRSDSSEWTAAAILPPCWPDRGYTSSRRSPATAPRRGRRTRDTARAAGTAGQSGRLPASTHGVLRDRGSIRGHDVKTATTAALPWRRRVGRDPLIRLQSLRSLSPG